MLPPRTKVDYNLPQESPRPPLRLSSLYDGTLILDREGHLYAKAQEFLVGIATNRKHPNRMFEPDSITYSLDTVEHQRGPFRVVESVQITVTSVKS